MKKVKRGDPMVIPANDWNKVADLANNLGGQSTPGAGQVGPELVRVKNTLGRNIARYSAVLIGSPTPAGLHTGKNDQVFLLVNGSIAGRLADYAPYTDHVIGILQEPIANNRIGLAQISGVTPARFRGGEAVISTNHVPSFAQISDLEDSLVFSQFGSIRVLHRNIASNAPFAASRYHWVQLGCESSIGSIVFCAQPETISVWAGASWDSIIWYAWGGDARSMGVYGLTTPVPPYQKGVLRVSRTGRYRTTVRWQTGVIEMPSGGFANGDRVELRIAWPGNAYQGISVPGWTETQSITYSAWSNMYFCGERSFYFNDGFDVPLPILTAKKIARSDGAVTNLTVGASTYGMGAIQVEIVRFGSSQALVYWDQARANTALGRSASAGPI